jgi:thiamine-phosphate pyrophosphorylase
LIMADAKPQCRLYLQVPALITARHESQISRALAATSTACVLLCNNGKDAQEVPADRLIDVIQGAGIACLMDDIERAERLGADGVHIAADLETYARARAVLGESANIGAGCGSSRHAAMQLAEAGADYVAFGPEDGSVDAIDQYAELIVWWSEVFVVPCVAWNVDSPSNAEVFARAGADFVAPSRTIWQDDNAATIIAEIDGAIRRVRSVA